MRSSLEMLVAKSALGSPPRCDAQSSSRSTRSEENPEVDGELSEEVSQLVDRLDVLRRHVDDLRLSVEDPVLARREMRNIVEEVEQVRAAMLAAYGSPGSPDARA